MSVQQNPPLKSTQPLGRLAAASGRTEHRQPGRHRSPRPGSRDTDQPWRCGDFLV